MEYRAVGTAGSTKVVWGLSLDEIAREVASPFNEEQAWGLCHQCSVKLSCLPPERVPPLQPGNVVVTAEGKVEVIAATDGKTYQHGSRELVYGLGVLVYSLLDHGLAEDEERDLSGPLEALIGWMILEEGSWASEGISDNNHMEHYFKVIKMCENRLKSVANPSAYYHSVCRALLDMALLIMKAKEEDPSEAEVLHEIRACWQEVMSEVERGMTLKKVPSRCQNVRRLSPALSDFEKLMLAISNFDRSRLKPPPPKDCALSSLHSLMMSQVKSKPALRPVQGCMAARRASVLTPRERLLMELCTPRALRSVSLCDISMNPTAVGSLRKKLTPSAAFINELKSKDIGVAMENKAGHILQQYDLNVGAGSPQRSSSARIRLVPSTDFLTELSKGTGAVQDVTTVMMSSDLTQKASSKSDMERKKLLPPQIFIEELQNKENIPQKVTSAVSTKGITQQFFSVGEESVPINSFQSIATERKKLTPPKSFLEDLKMELGSPRRELKRSTSVGSSMCEEVTVIFMSPQLCHTAQLGEDTSVGGIILVMSCPRQREHFGGHVEVSLTFSEIVHIRRTVTEAELSSLQEEDEQLFNSISTGKVCYVCQQRLSVSLFSHHKLCLICERTVCPRCYNSVEILDLDGQQMAKKATICISCENFLCTFVVP